MQGIDVFLLPQGFSVKDLDTEWKLRNLKGVQPKQYGSQCCGGATCPGGVSEGDAMADTNRV